MGPRKLDAPSSPHVCCCPDSPDRQAACGGTLSRQMLMFGGGLGIVGTA